jgi:hypothetical protein
VFAFRSNYDSSARNALLFTLIVDGHPLERIWDIFYHFKLDDKSSLVLTQHCKKLVAVSSDLGSWTTSSYSLFLRVCSRRTLAELHRHWQFYAFGAHSKEKNESISRAFTREYELRTKEASEGNLTPGRSAGLFLMDAFGELSSDSKRYWRTGTMITDPGDVRPPKLINPTFVYSLPGEGCALHYGTYPLQGFHLASAYSHATTQQARKAVKIGHLVKCAKSQFGQWCSAFKVAVKPSSPEKVIIRLFVGDALEFSRTLYHYQRTSSISASLFASAWAGEKIELDGTDYSSTVANPAPAKFDIIDTSNLVDHAGLLNIIITALPLLSQEPSSTLYTETLLPKGEEALNGLRQKLCTDLPVVALLFGICPVSYVSGFSSDSNIHELMLLNVLGGEKPTQYHERIAWKVPYSGDPIAMRERAGLSLQASFQPLELARLLFDIYYQMFVDEDMVQKFKNRTVGESVIHYNRGTFAALLGFVRSKVDTDWTRTITYSRPFNVYSELLPSKGGETRPALSWTKTPPDGSDRHLWSYQFGCRLSILLWTRREHRLVWVSIPPESLRGRSVQSSGWR